MHAPKHTCTHSGPHTCKPQCMHAHTHMHTRTHARTHARTYACTYVRMYICRGQLRKCITAQCSCWLHGNKNDKRLQSLNRPLHHVDFCNNSVIPTAGISFMYTSTCIYIWGNIDSYIIKYYIALGIHINICIYTWIESNPVSVPAHTDTVGYGCIVQSGDRRAAHSLSMLNYITLCPRYNAAVGIHNMGPFWSW